MSIRDIFSLGSRYLQLGIVVALFIAVLFLGFYFFYYKKHQSKQLKIRKIFLYGVFICYMVVVVGVTMMRGGAYWQGQQLLPPFYSYREAWNTFSAVDWRNIILNILMFVPFGFLLPFLSEKFKVFWKTYLAGFVFTLLIECVQLVFKIGIFECDDLLNNLAGAMIGYGCYQLIQFFVSKIRKREAKLVPVLFAQIPTIVIVGIFGAVFGIYNGKELGNLSCNYIYKLKNVEVESEAAFAAEEGSAMVYQLHVSNQDETEQLAEAIFNQMGLKIDESRTILYDDTAIYYSTSNEETESKSLWIDYLGNTFSYTDFDRFSEEDEAELKKNTAADEAEIREALEDMGILVPEGAVFQYDDENQVYRFTANGYVIDHKLYQGDITCEYSENGTILDLNYGICEYKEYKEFTIISEQDAFEKVKEGMFQCVQTDSCDVWIENVSLGYHTDSKGFYQPVYLFQGTVNGEDAVINIPAIE